MAPSADTAAALHERLLAIRQTAAESLTLDLPDRARNFIERVRALATEGLPTGTGQGKGTP